MTDFAWRGLTTRARQMMAFTPIDAILGDDSDPSHLYDPLIDGNVYARILYAGGTYGPVISVRGPIGTTVKLKPNVPVKLVWTADRRLAVSGYDVPGSTQSGTDLLAANRPTLNSGAFIGQQSLATALVTPQSVPDLTVVVKGWVVIAASTIYVFPGTPSGGKDLTSYVPSAGNQRYAMVYIDSDFLTVNVTTSTPRGIGDRDLDVTDLQECLSAGASSGTPLAAVRLYGGQTAITNSDIKHDVRQIINTSSQTSLNLLTDNNGDVLSDNNGDVLFF